MHLGKRLASHIMGCDSSRDRRVRKNIWLTEILKAGFVPGIKVIERIDNGISWELAEIKWIAHYRQILGDSLLNVSIGGAGPKGYKFTDEQRARVAAANKKKPSLYGRVVSEETRAKTSASLKGRKSTRVGYSHSAETLEKMSASRKGRKLTDEHRAKLSEIRKGRAISEETKKKIGAKVSAAAARKRAMSKIAMQAQL